jgi:hypothetical protein
MEKSGFRINIKHPGSATLQLSQTFLEMGKGCEGDGSQQLVKLLNVIKLYLH